MFTKKMNEPTGLEKAIDSVLSEMEALNSDDAEYAKMVDQLEKLYKIRNNNTNRVSPDTLAIIAGNIAGILLIIHHEKANVVTSKAMSFVMKLK